MNVPVNTCIKEYQKYKQQAEITGACYFYVQAEEQYT